MDKKTRTAIYIVLVLFLVYLINIKPKMVIAPDEDLLKESPEFDYSSEEVQNAISKISGNTEYQKLKMTLEYIDDNIEYSSSVSAQECYAETASRVLRKGVGDCVSKSRVAVAMLRGLNIQSWTVGGCVQETYTCGSLMALPSEIIERPERVKEIDDFKKRGYLHEWIEVIADGKTYLVDPTSKAIFNKNCRDYRIFSYDTTPVERCVINNNAFVESCYYW